MTSKSSKSASPPALPPPAPTATDMSPEVEEARRRSKDVANKMRGYQSTILTGAGGLSGTADAEKKKLLGG